MIRSIVLQQMANKQKSERIIELLPHWQQALNDTLNFLTRNIKNSPYPAKHDSRIIHHLNTVLSARQCANVYEQAYECFASTIVLKQDQIRKMITNLDIDSKHKQVLYRLNVNRAWHQKAYELDWYRNLVSGTLSVPTKEQRDSGDNIVSVPVDSHYLSIVRRLFKQTKAQYGDLSKVRVMKMGTTIAKRETSRTKHSDYWVQISTLVKRKPVLIPFKSNPYFDKRLEAAIKSGSKTPFRGQIQVKICENGEVTYTFLLDEKNAAPRKKGKSVGLDANLNDESWFSDSDGNHYGADFVKWLKIMDARIVKRQAWCQSNDVLPSMDDQFSRLVKRARDHTKNELGRILNKIVKPEDVQRIVTEELDFRGQSLGKTMNRLLTKMGRKILKQKLARIAEEYGVETVTVNPAYTSQECSNCGYVSKQNRNGRNFVCGCCNMKLHADTNAARSIKGRSLNNIDLYAGCSRDKIREKLVREHSSRACSLNRVTGASNQNILIEHSKSKA